MHRYLTLCFLLTTVPGATGSEHGLQGIAANLARAGLVMAGLALDGSAPSEPDQAAADDSKPCARVSFSRSLKYGESDLNVLDVATVEFKEATPRPVLLFVAGESFTRDDDAADTTDSLEDEAMCFATRHGMVGVRMTYRPAPANPWPAGAGR